MFIWNRLYKELGISLDGLRKGLMEIAITMSENTQIAKLLYQIFELQKKVDKLYTKTGQIVHELHPLTLSEIEENERVKENLSRLKSLQSDIHRIEKEINLLREERTKTRLDELTQYMRRGGYTIEEFIVEHDSYAINKSAIELILPQDSQIIAIIHKEKFNLPDGRLRLTEGDRVFVLSPPNILMEAAAIFSSSRQTA
ncbi:MAG TPA: TrkA C-terminal domain-containing protein [Nitrospirota bacterium]